MTAAALPQDGRLADNIAHFARALRHAGLRVGPGRVVDAVRAVAAAGFTGRTDFYWVLHASFVSRPEDRAVFDQVFRLFWRDPQFLEQMMSLLLPQVRGTHDERLPDAAERRAAQALLEGVARDVPQHDEDAPLEVEIDAAHTVSADERLRTLDFEQMSTAELAEARRAIARLTLPVQPIRGRRSAPAAGGRRPDWRATIRRSLARGGEMARPEMRRPQERWPSLVALCDISGSMAQYSRMVLHFLHAVTNRQGKGQGWAQVHAFTFGTRLTNITRHLARRDVDAALAAAGSEAQDWQGGTRIGDCLHAFNRDWSRRVTGQGAVVLLITDGLDRAEDGGALLGREIERLHLSARRLIWINPLLRWDGFLPRATGVRVMLPHVDCFRAAHSIASLEGLSAAIASARDSGEKDRLMALMDRSG